MGWEIMDSYRIENFKLAGRDTQYTVEWQLHIQCTGRTYRLVLH